MATSFLVKYLVDKWVDLLLEIISLDQVDQAMCMTLKTKLYAVLKDKQRISF